MPVLTVVCKNQVPHRKTGVIGDCGRFLTRIRYEKFFTPGAIFEQELICAACKARTHIIRNQSISQFDVLVLARHLINTQTP